MKATSLVKFLRASGQPQREDAGDLPQQSSAGSISTGARWVHSTALRINAQRHSAMTKTYLLIDLQNRHPAPGYVALAPGDGQHRFSSERCGARVFAPSRGFSTSLATELQLLLRERQTTVRAREVVSPEHESFPMSEYNFVGHSKAPFCKRSCKTVIVSREVVLITSSL